MAKQTFTTGQVLTAAQMTSLQQTAMLGGAASAKTASYTLVAADAGTAISMSNASATTITVNTALFAAGDTVQITNLGAGVCTITAGTATVNTSASLALAQYESGTLDFTSTSAAIFIKGAGAAASSGATLLTQSVSANYYRVDANVTGAAATPGYYNATFYVPVYLPTGTADRLVVRTAGSYSGTAAVRMGIYNNTNGFPTTVLVDGGTISATAANTTYSITISTAITAGWYWLAVNVPDNGGNNDYWTFDFSSRTTLVNGFSSSNSSAITYVTNPLGYYQTGVTGAFATAGTLVGLEGVFPIIKVRVS